MKRISIDTITRLEGHGKIDILLDERGDMAKHVLKMRPDGYEPIKLLGGRLDLPLSSDRIGNEAQGME